MKIADDGPRDRVRDLPIKATRLIAVCGKCGRKIGGGFGERRDKALSKVLRRSTADAKGKRAKIRIVETRCLDICPKRAVAVLDSERPGRVIIVPAGVSADVVAERLGVATPAVSPSDETAVY